MPDRAAPPAQKTVVLIPISRVAFTNDRPNKAVIRAIVAGYDRAKMRPVCAHQVGTAFILTDGNHRTEAFRQLGYTHVPAVLLTREEFDYVKCSDRTLDFIVHVPDPVPVLR